MYSGDALSRNFFSSNIYRYCSMFGIQSMTTFLKLILVVGFLLLLLPFLLVVPKDVASYWLRELSYQHIADRIDEKCSSDKCSVELAAAFFYMNEADPRPPFPIVDHTVHTDLMRGLGRCDQRVNGMITVLDKLDLDGRFLIFNCHTVAEFYIDGDTLIVDPTENVLWRKSASKGDSVSFTCIGNTWEAETFDSVQVPNYRYRSVATCGEGRKNDILRNRKSSTRKVLDGVISGYHRVFSGSLSALLVQWMSALGHLKNDQLYGTILSEEELASGVYGTARVFELLQMGGCSSSLPCFWKLDTDGRVGADADFRTSIRALKRNRLTKTQLTLFSDQKP